MYCIIFLYYYKIYIILYFSTRRDALKISKNVWYKDYSTKYYSLFKDHSLCNVYLNTFKLDGMNKDAQFKCRILHSFELDSINKVKHNLNTALQYIRSIFKLDDMRHLQ